MREGAEREELRKCAELDEVKQKESELAAGNEELRAAIEDYTTVIEGIAERFRATKVRDSTHFVRVRNSLASGR